MKGRLSYNMFVLMPKMPIKQWARSPRLVVRRLVVHVILAATMTCDGRITTLKML